MSLERKTMLSQSNEALCSAAYVENYLDCTESLPDELQRHLSRMRELDVEYQSFVATFRKCLANHLEILRSNGEDASSWRRALLRAQNELIAAQEVGDEKMNVMYQLQDHIENKIRQMDIDFRKLDYGKDQENTEPNKDSLIQSIPVPGGSSRSDNGISSGGTAGAGSGAGSGAATGSVGGGSGAGSGSGASAGERSSKRSRRTRTDNISMSIAAESNSNMQEPSSVTESRREISSSSTSNSTSAKKNANTGGGAGKKKKRKSRNTTQNQTSQQSGHQQTPPREDEMAIDPDEPTYCLCDQISFGEMILCDNDLCPIEWFHFGCVALSTKPKGKWYCPKCRGDRPNVMKPKSVFLKELERYNKEKEEKS